MKKLDMHTCTSYLGILAALPLETLTGSVLQNCCTINFFHCPLVHSNKPLGATVCNGGSTNLQAKTTNP